MGDQQVLIGSKISLTSQKDIRYEGVVVNIDQNKKSITLRFVKNFGTEGRVSGPNEVPPSDQLYDSLEFPVDTIKQLTKFSDQYYDQRVPPGYMAAGMNPYFPYYMPSMVSFPPMGPQQQQMMGMMPPQQMMGYQMNFGQQPPQPQQVPQPQSIPQQPQSQPQQSQPSQTTQSSQSSTQDSKSTTQPRPLSGLNQSAPGSKAATPYLGSPLAQTKPIQAPLPATKFTPTSSTSSTSQPTVAVSTPVTSTPISVQPQQSQQTSQPTSSSNVANTSISSSNQGDQKSKYRSSAYEQSKPRNFDQKQDDGRGKRNSSYQPDFKNQNRQHYKPNEPQDKTTTETSTEQNQQQNQQQSVEQSNRYRDNRNGGYRQSYPSRGGYQFRGSGHHHHTPRALQSDFDYEAATASFELLKLSEKNEEESNEHQYYDKSTSFFDQISCESKDKSEAGREERMSRYAENKQNFETFGVSRPSYGRGDGSYRGRGGYYNRYHNNDHHNRHQSYHRGGYHKEPRQQHQQPRSSTSEHQN